MCREILTKYLGCPSLIHRPEFLKTQEHSNGLELDIFYPQYGFEIEVQDVQREKYHEFFHGGDPIILSNSGGGINSKKNCAKRIGLS